MVDLIQVVGGESCLLILVAVAPLEQSHRRHRRKQPGQFRHFRHIRLLPEDRLLGIESARHEIQRHVEEFFRRCSAVEQRRHGMVIRDEIKRLALVLKLDGGPHHAEVVSEVKAS